MTKPPFFFLLATCVALIGCGVSQSEMPKPAYIVVTDGTNYVVHSTKCQWSSKLFPTCHAAEELCQGMIKEDSRQAETDAEAQIELMKIESNYNKTVSWHRAECDK